jgi:hypothetical protein
MNVHSLYDPDRVVFFLHGGGGGGGGGGGVRSVLLASHEPQEATLAADALQNLLVFAYVLPATVSFVGMHVGCRAIATISGQRVA